MIVVSTQSDTQGKVKIYESNASAAHVFLFIHLNAIIQRAEMLPCSPASFASQNGEAVMHILPSAPGLDDLVAILAFLDEIHCGETTIP